MWAWTERKGAAASANPALRSYWFQEGIAEWYGGAHRIIKPDGSREYEVGLMHLDRVSSIEKARGAAGDRLFSIRELVSTRYLDRSKIEADGRVYNLYAQAWFLIYFMNHFNVDAQGFVDPTKPGKYKARWEEYVKQELRGKTGLDVLMKTMQLDDKALEDLEVEYWRYFQWISKKSSYGHVVDKKVLPWDVYRNKRGEATGEKSDDLLPPLDPEIVPPRWNG
jgi:hypothetical protein